MRNHPEKKNASAASATKPADPGNAQGKTINFVVSSVETGQRLDITLARHVPDLTRTMLTRLLRSGNILVDGQGRKSSYRVKTAEAVSIVIPPPVSAKITPVEVFFHLLHEDDDLIVISKPPDLVVHPSFGHHSATLVHGLLAHCKNLSGINGELRPGIVHRLDKDTSGVMVAAKNDHAHQALQKQFKQKKVTKIYRAVIDGTPKNDSGRIVSRLGRHPVHRKKMAVLEQGGRDSVSNWQILEKLPNNLSYVELRPETGRTHQLRVHMASMGHPIVGDILYGKKMNTYDKLDVKRMCLHAYKLSFTHPGSESPVSFKAPLWPDIRELLDRVRDM